jgi:Thioredoxin
VIVQVGIAVVLLSVALGVAWWLEHRHHAPALITAATAPVPAQLHRADFPHPEAPWLVVVFSSSTCDGCAPMVEKAKALESHEVAVADIEYHEHRDVHERYGIEGVPVIVVVDHEGVTRKHFSGNATATDLWAAVAELRAG